MNRTYTYLFRNALKKTKIINSPLVAIFLLCFYFSFCECAEKSIVEWISKGNYGDRYPRFSSDGKKIVFQSERDGNVDIYIISINNGIKRITYTNAIEMHPVFSPDSSQIAYTLYSSSGDRNSKVYMINLKTNKKSVITEDPNIYGAIPCFSPDGRKLAVALWRTNKNSTEFGQDFIPEIFLIDLATKKQTRLTYNLSEDWRPVFSPDGQKIVFISNRDGNFEVYLMAVDGNNQTRLTVNDADEWDPSFSPDGKHIVFASRRDGNWNIYIMDLNGSNQIQLTNNSGDEWDPSFSPDGKKIIFAGKRDEKQGIFIMKNPLSD